MENLEWKKLLWEVLKSLALGVAAVASFFANRHAEEAKEGIEQTKIQMAQKNHQAELNMKAFEFVEKTLALDPKKSKGQGLAAAAIVNALTEPPLRDGLQHALSANGLNDPVLIKKIEDAQKFDSEESNFDSAASNPAQEQSSILLDSFLKSIGNSLIAPAYAEDSGLYRVDIFYCEDFSTSTTRKRELQAQEAMRTINAQEPSAITRVRLLPSLVQARPGYQVFSDEIRYNEAEKERPIANRIATLIRVTSLNNISYKSPGYISVFYCGR